jgi:hypothetical protein
VDIVVVRLPWTASEKIIEHDAVERRDGRVHLPPSGKSENSRRSPVRYVARVA